MNLSDLLHARVVDEAGEELGKVVDVRLSQDGPAVEGSDATLRVTGMVLGRKGLGARLGYHRASLKGPWLLRVLFTALERTAPYVEWAEVADWDPDARTVRLNVPKDRLRPLART